MRAEVVRNKEAGEFTCMLWSYALAKGATAARIARVHDICEEVNAAMAAGFIPEVGTTGRGPERRFSVTWGNAALAEDMGAVGAYRILDGIEDVWPGYDTATVSEGRAPQSLDDVFIPSTTTPEADDSLPHEQPEDASEVGG